MAHIPRGAQTACIVAGEFVPTGGMDMPNLALARYLANRGWLVELVAHSVSHDLLAHPNVRVHHVRRPVGSNLLGEPWLDFIGRRVAARVAAAGGRVIVNGGNCGYGDVNWVHFVHAAHTPTLGSGWPWRVKRLISHQWDCSRERAALRAARCIIADSHRTRRDILTHLPVDPQRAHVVYYGIDPDAFAPASAQQRAATRAALGWPYDALVAAFIGGLGDRRKGFDTLFTAWERLAAHPDWNVKLAVIGAGTELAYWQARAKASPAGRLIEFLGFRRDVPSLLAACDLLVSPTRYEPYGQGVHEALCCGLPALVTAGAGVAERYPPDLGELLLPTPDSPDVLAERLRLWHANPRRWQQPLLALSAYLRRQTWDVMAGQITALLDQSAC